MADGDHVDELKQAFQACGGEDSGSVSVADLIPKLRQLGEWDLVDRLRRSQSDQVSFADLLGHANLEHFLDNSKDEDMAVSDTTSELDNSSSRLRMSSLDDDPALKEAQEEHAKKEESEKEEEEETPAAPPESPDAEEEEKEKEKEAKEKEAKEKEAKEKEVKEKEAREKEAKKKKKKKKEEKSKQRQKQREEDSSASQASSEDSSKMTVAVAVLVESEQEKKQKRLREGRRSASDESSADEPTTPPRAKFEGDEDSSDGSGSATETKTRSETPIRSPFRWLRGAFTKRKQGDEGWEDAAALHRDARGTPPDKSSDTAEEKSVHRERRSAAKGERTSRPSSESRPRSSSSRGGRRKGDSAAEASEKPPKTPSKPPSEKFEMRKSAASAAREAPLGPPAQESSKKQKGDRAASKARPNYEENAEKLADERSADDSGEPSKTAQGSKAGNKYSEHKKKHFRHATELPRSSYADPVKPSERVQRPSGRAHARHASEMPSREPVLSVDDHYVARTHLEGAEARRDPIPGRLRLHGLVGERLEHMMELQYRKNVIGEQDVGLLRTHAPRNSGGPLQIIWEGMLDKKGTTTLLGAFHHRYVILYGTANGNKDDMELRWYRRKVESSWGSIPIEERGSIPLSRVDSIEPILRGKTQRSFIIHLRTDELPVDHDDDDDENIDDENSQAELDPRDLVTPQTVRAHSQKGLSVSSFTFRAETGLQAKLWVTVLKGFVEEINAQ